MDLQVPYAALPLGSWRCSELNGKFPCPCVSASVRGMPVIPLTAQATVPSFPASPCHLTRRQLPDALQLDVFMLRAESLFPEHFIPFVGGKGIGPLYLRCHRSILPLN